MATPVEAPKLGNTVEECVVSRWVKRKGEPVSAGDVVVEIETDKATFEVTAPVSGTVLDTFFEQGALVPVFTNLFVVGEPGENGEEFRPQAADRSLTVAARYQEAARCEAPHEAGPEAASLPAGSFSPRARRFAEEHHFYPSAVAGSGPGGRVLEEDLRAQFYSPGKRTAAAPSVPAPPAGIREKIARRMRESLATTAQYTLHSSANAGGLLRLRAAIKAAAGVPNINVNELVAFCTVKALLIMPELNSEYIDGKIHKHSEVHLGFACDTPRGLLVPVVRDAHTLAVGDLALRMKELTAQAVGGKIGADDLSGATFTVSNLGSLGIESFTPLLNPPQVAILGVGSIELKPARREGKVEFADAIGLSLTCDHQVIDGAPGARFLIVLKEQIESVESLCTI